MRRGLLCTSIAACLAFGGLGAASASADVVCAFDQPSHTVTVTVTGPARLGVKDGVFRAGDAIVTGYSGETGDFPQCGTATVHNTDTVVIDNYIPSVYLTLPTNLGPGFTDEPGDSDEIEMQLNFGLGSDGIELYPTRDEPGPKVIRLGTDGPTTLINVNADEGDGADPDIAMTKADQVAIFMGAEHGGTAADDVRADGSGGTGGSPLRANLTVEGGPGDDDFLGGSGQDYLAGGDGEDLLDGALATDSLYGGDGDDTLRLGDGGNTDRINGENGNDTIYGGDGDDMRMFGGPGDDLILGGPGRDRIEGNEGDDTLDTGPGDDRRIEGDAGDDLIRGGAGDDTAIRGGPGRDRIFGGPGDDVSIYGGARADVISGGRGNDSLFGQDGNDLVDGGLGGRDYCRGGIGHDRAKRCELTPGSG